MMIVELTSAQHNRLDAIADKDPGAKVVGQSFGEPVIRHGDGRVTRLLPSGRLSSGLKLKEQFAA